MLEALGVSLSIGRQQILADVSLAVAPGQLVAVVGPNGAGKSMLFGILAGDTVPDSGAVLLDGRDIRRMRLSALAERRAVLPQASTLAFPFTVHEIVRLGLRDRAAPRIGARIVEEALARVDLPGFGDRFFQELSGGERQRVHLARTLVQVWEPMLGGMPRYLMLDEPTNSLDLKHQELTLACARSFADSGGGVLAILHDINLATAHADSIVVLKDGRVFAAGVPASVVTAALMRDVFEVRPRVVRDASSGQPFLLPAGFVIDTSASTDVRERTP